MSEHDEERRCADCGRSFWFRAGEQRFFARRGLPDAPRRCADCRRQRKAERREAPASTTRPSRERVPLAPAISASATDDAALPRCALCGGVARVPASVHADVLGHRPVACEACYRWRLGFGSGVGEPA